MAERVAVVGAGIVGLSTAWFLQEHGIHVTVLERRHVAAGSSWGNAGWLTPALTAPLPEPAVLTYGLRALLSPSSPVYVPPRADVRLLRFLLGFARHSTARRWGVGMRAYAPLNRLALDAFDELGAGGPTTGGVMAGTRSADPFLACFTSHEESTHLVQVLRAVEASGQEVKFDVLSGEEVRGLEPSLTAATTTAVRLHDQRFIDPPAYLKSLADAVYDRGAQLLEPVSVHQVQDTSDGVLLRGSDGHPRSFDAVVLANGAWLGDLAQPFGVRQPVRAGRGYSFSVACEKVPQGPLYFPTQRVACTPIPTPAGLRLRVAGMMEFRPADAALDPRRIDAIVAAARPMLAGADLDERHDEWVGSRPCTPDGLPLIGATRSPRVFAAGGHGMWGVALGPVTGKLLAERIVTGVTPPALTPFDPLR